MAAVGVRELKAKASEIIERSSRGERFLVTRRGRPISVLLPIDDDLEDFVLANATDFVRMRERARREYRAGKTRPWRDVRRELTAKGKRVAVARRAR